MRNKIAEGIAAPFDTNSLSIGSPCAGRRQAQASGAAVKQIEGSAAPPAPVLDPRPACCSPVRTTPCGQDPCRPCRVPCRAGAKLRRASDTVLACTAAACAAICADSSSALVRDLCASSFSLCRCASITSLSSCMRSLKCASNCCSAPARSSFVTLHTQVGGVPQARQRLLRRA